MDRFASNIEEFTRKDKFLYRTALVIYFIPCAGIKWGHFVKGFLEFYDIHLGTIGEDILNFLGLGIKKGLNQKGIGPTTDKRFKQTKASCNDLLAGTVIICQYIESFSVIIVHGNPIFTESVTQ